MRQSSSTTSIACRLHCTTSQKLWTLQCLSRQHTHSRHKDLRLHTCRDVSKWIRPVDPIAEQFAKAASNDKMELEKRLRHECAPSTPATSSQGVHVASGQAA